MNNQNQNKFEKEIYKIKNVRIENLDINYPKLNKDDENVSNKFKNLFYSHFLKMMIDMFERMYYIDRPSFFDKETEIYENNREMFVKNKSNYIYLGLMMYFREIIYLNFELTINGKIVKSDDKFIKHLYDKFFVNYYKEIFDEYYNKCLIEITKKEYIDFSTPYLCCIPLIEILGPYIIKFLREERFEFE